MSIKMISLSAAVALSTVGCVSMRAAAQPANDLCSHATPVLAPSMTPGTTVGATIDAGVQTCVVAYNTPGVWYTLVGAGRTIVADVCIADYDTKLYAFCATGAPCNAPGSFACVTGNDDSFSCTDVSHSRVQFCAAPGQAYYLLVAGFGGATGGFTLTVSDAAPCSGAVSCAPQGACCSGLAVCTRTTQGSCAGSWSYAGVCSPTPCLGACCNTGTGACTATAPANCAGAFRGLGTSCSPNPCGGACCDAAGNCATTGTAGCTGSFMGLLSACSPTPCDLAAPASPANSRCASAAPFNGPGFSTVGANTNAATDPSPPVCNSSSRDVWYAFTPSVSDNYSVSLCQTALDWDSVLSIHSACPTPGASNQMAGACNDDGCLGGSGLSAIPGIAMAAGSTYFIRVAGFGIGGTNTGGFTLSVGEVLGACCARADGACEVTIQLACPVANTWTAGAPCAAGTCDPFRGACCEPSTGVCGLAFQVSCPGPQSFLGAGSACSPVNACPQPIGACCAPGGACMPLPAGVCSGTSTFAGSGTTCTPDACPAAPLNDACLAATTASLGITPGTLIGASSDGAASCGFSDSRDVYFSFTPPLSGGYEIDLCSTGTPWDSIISVHTGCPATVANQTAAADCDDDGCGAVAGLSKIGECNLAAGAAYIVRVAGYSPATVGAAFVLAIRPLITGACCDSAGACSVTTSTLCIGLYLGDGLTCAPAPCPAAGACCDNLNGLCRLATQAACNAAGPAGGTYRGDHSLCEPSPCPPAGSCCALCCAITTHASCPGAWTPGGVCSPDPCVAPSNDQPAAALPLILGIASSGLNCNATELNDGPPASCQNDAHKGVWYTFTAPASAAFAFSACGSNQDTVLTIFNSALAAELACDDDGCDGNSPPGSGFESLIESVLLAQGSSCLIRLSSYGSDPAGGAFTLTVSPAEPLGNCCAQSGACTLTSAAACSGAFTQDALCAPSPCPPPAGACCRGSMCALVPAPACAGVETLFHGAGTSCNTGGNQTTPCCLADFNHNGAITVQDLFDFLIAYFAAGPLADCNASGTVSVQDIFAYLVAYFTGCV